jgi:WD40 repeat protein
VIVRTMNTHKHLILCVLMLLYIGVAQAQDTTPEPPALDVITPENAARLEQIGQLGRGAIGTVRWLDNDHIEQILTDETRIYDANDLTLPPEIITERPPEPTLPYEIDRELDGIRNTATGEIILLEDLPLPYEGDEPFLEREIWNAFPTPDQRYLIITTQEGPGEFLRVWDMVSGVEVFSSFCCIGWVQDLAFSDDGTVLYVGSQGKVLRWDFIGGQLQNQSIIYDGYADYTQLELLNNGELIIENYVQGCFEIVLPETQEVISQHCHENLYSAIDMNHDYTAVAWSERNRLIIWDVTRNGVATTIENPYQTYRSHQNNYHIEFSPDGSKLLTSGEGYMIVWDLANSAIVSLLPDFYATGVAIFTYDSRQVAVAINREILIWDVNSQQQIRALSDTELDIFRLIYSPDGEILLDASYYRASIRIRDGQTLELLETITLDNELRDVAFSPDGSIIAYAQRWNFYLRDVNAIGEEGAFTIQHQDAYDFSFNEDGRQIATAGLGGVLIWDLESQQETRILPGLSPTLQGEDVAFSPDGRWLAALIKPTAESQQVELYIWDLERNLLDIQPCSPSGLRFTPNGQLLAACGGIIDVATGDLISELDPVAFSPDGRMLLTYDLELYGVPAR